MATPSAETPAKRISMFCELGAAHAFVKPSVIVEHGAQVKAVPANIGHDSVLVASGHDPPLRPTIKRLDLAIGHWRSEPAGTDAGVRASSGVQNNSFFVLFH